MKLIWKIEYWYGLKSFSVKSYYPGTKGDLVYIWGQDYQISSVKYYPEESRIAVSLTQHFTL